MKKIKNFSALFAGGSGGRTGDFSDALRNLRGAAVLGINPPVYDFAWFDLWSKPAGLLALLGNLRSAGNNVSLIDCLYEGRTKPLTFGRWKVVRTPVEKPEPYREIPRRYYRFGLGGAELKKRLASSPRPDVIFVTSAMTYWYMGVFEAVKAAKEVFPGSPVILGGAYARLCPEHAGKSGADFIQTAPLCLPFEGVAMDLYGAPSYGVLVTSFGCPMNCGYCAARTLWPGFVQRPLEEIFSDLAAQAAAVTDIAFYDDALLVDKENRFYPLCRHIRENYSHPRLRLHTPNGLHVAQLDDECCETLFRTGFKTIRLSLEGTDEFTGSVSSGKTGADDYARAAASLLRAGYGPEDVETYILAGLPGQNTEDVRASIAKVRSLGCTPKLAEFSPIPGTALYAESLRHTPQIAGEPLLHNNTIYASYVSKTLPPGALQELKDLAKGGARP